MCAVCRIVVATLAVILVALSQPPVTRRPSVGDGTIRAVHYFGLSRYGWPINYLSAVELDRVDGELAQIAADGFNGIVLLVPWGEVQPGLTPHPSYSDTALSRLNALVGAAEARGLEVILRVPYAWAINPDQQMPNVERMGALFFDDRVRATFIDAIRTIDRRVVKPHSNVRLAFASWEDFYMIQHVPAGALPLQFRESFSRFARERHDAATLASIFRTPIDPVGLVPLPKANAPGWQVFLEFIDTRIAAITAEMARALSVPFSFEVRVDGDPVLVDGRITEWFLHNKTYDVSTSDVTTVYYAPYLGQMNVGERLTAAQAMKGLRSALDGIHRHTKNRLFIDQFNVVYNSPGFKAHARLLDAEMDRFLDQAAAYIANETLGYALWAYKDYHQNLLYNPSFQQGLHGWETDGRVQHGSHGLELRAGAAVRQVVGAERMAQAVGPDAPLQLCVWASSATGGAIAMSDGVAAYETFVLSAEGPTTRGHCVDLRKRPGDYTVTFRALSGPVLLDGAVMSAHHEIADIYDVENRPAQLRSTFVRFNRQFAAARSVSKPPVLNDDDRPGPQQ